MIHLANSRRLQLAWSWPTVALKGDCRLEILLPENDTYTFSLHDVEYAAPAPSFFRVRVSQWPAKNVAREPKSSAVFGSETCQWLFADGVFPPAVEKGRRQHVELLPFALGRDLLPTTVTGPMPVSLPADSGFSGPRPYVLVSAHAEVVNRAAPGKVHDLPAGPVGVSGWLSERFAEARYRVPIAEKTKAIGFEVFAERLGSNVDAALVLRNEQGAELGRAEDGPGTLDPVLNYTVPDKLRTLVVSVVDSQGRGGPGKFYRLVVLPRTTVSSRSGYRVLTVTQRMTLPIGGHAVLPVTVEPAAS